MKKRYSKVKTYSLILFIVLILSCNKKDNSNCYTCSTTWIVTTSSQVSGYPLTTTTSVELCDATPKQISDYEEATQGSESNTIDNVVYSSSHSTKCRSNQ